ncbi:hypothetical protein DRW41_11930 [Neobacillus piezotolerans]|uniref:DUF1836 domain-containing protein n=1 Tax=Neobacillus piezotolerans TaxID=2259171 RepID=A0A3D8GQI9_9BACI|nr:DUF1836 domain-containing protein [Neobacillus piezotolerans]RDU36754.1 hypothetical protein DRW41_11930 [Neobacillus piezotolerans]
MKDLDELIDSLKFEKQIQLEDMPSIDLYMDQVIQLFENTFGETRRNEEEKILTKTMINNYAKGNLFFPVKKKKYTRGHLILISLIYQLKGSLSITDIKGVLSGINARAVNGGLDLGEFYSAFLALSAENEREFRAEAGIRSSGAAREAGRLQGGDEELEKTLLIASLVNMSNMYRRLAEKLADELQKESLDALENK